MGIGGSSASSKVVFNHNRLSQGNFNKNSVLESEDIYSDDSDCKVIYEESTSSINDKIMPIRANDFYRGHFNKNVSNSSQ